MSDGHGCDAGHHCGPAQQAGGAGDPGYALGADGKTPVANVKRAEINGAPIVEASHEFVLRKPDAQN